jgi:transposase
MGKQVYRKIDWTNKRVLADLRKMAPTAFVHKYKVSYPRAVKQRKVMGLSRPHSTRKAVPRGFKKQAQRMSIAAMAEKYGVCRSTVTDWRAQVGVKGFAVRKTEDAMLVEQIQHYANLEWAGAAIAKKLRVGNAKVHRLAREYGIVFRPVLKDMRKVRNNLMVALVASGLSQDQVGRVFGVSRQRVQQVVGPKEQR